VWQACAKLLALQETCLDVSVREAGSQHFAKSNHFYFPSKQSAPYVGNWVAAEEGNSTMSIRRTTK